MALISIESRSVWFERILQIGFERESDEYLVRLDPTKWKDQDHYLVLGLQRLRYLASEDDIRRAHRRKALKHHPDKRGKLDFDLDSDYYGSITRAMDILNDAFKRQSYDSVDPTFDDAIPSRIKKTLIETRPGIFYKTFGPVFRLNARWSIKQPVPDLGDESSSRDHVENFYDFWYNFQSWRQFAYLDEEDKETGENREERRWLDKKNKAARLERKKEEVQRIRELVDNAYYCDLRIIKFKNEDKQRKEEQKRAKRLAAEILIEKAEAEHRLRVEEEGKKLQRLELEEKAEKELEKKAKTKAKNNLKKAVKSLEDYAKNCNYFVVNENEKLTHLEELDKLCRLSTSDKLIEMRESLQNAPNDEEKRAVFLDQVRQLNDRIRLENEKSLGIKSQITNIQPTNNQPSRKKNDWSKDEVTLLIKAVSTFPAGTKDRWDVVAKYLKTHSPNHNERDSKQVLAKVKELQQSLVRSMKH